MRHLGIILGILSLVILILGNVFAYACGKDRIDQIAKNQAIKTLTNYGGEPLKTSWTGTDSTITYHTCWEITDEEIRALYVLSKDFEIILYTE